MEEHMWTMPHLNPPLGDDCWKNAKEKGLLSINKYNNNIRSVNSETCWLKLTSSGGGNYVAEVRLMRLFLGWVPPLGMKFRCEGSQ